jgi:hypothetical protein
MRHRVRPYVKSGDTCSYPAQVLLYRNTHRRFCNVWIRAGLREDVGRPLQTPVEALRGLIGINGWLGSDRKGRRYVASLSFDDFVGAGF